MTTNKTITETQSNIDKGSKEFAPSMVPFYPSSKQDIEGIMDGIQVVSWDVTGLCKALVRVKLDLAASATRQRRSNKAASLRHKQSVSLATTNHHSTLEVGAKVDNLTRSFEEYRKAPVKLDLTQLAQVEESVTARILSRIASNLESTPKIPSYQHSSGCYATNSLVNPSLVGTVWRSKSNDHLYKVVAQKDDRVELQIVTAGTVGVKTHGDPKVTSLKTGYTRVRSGQGV